MSASNAPASSVGSNLFHRLPPEIIRLTAVEIDSSATLANLCLVDHFCNAICTPVLYGKKIRLERPETFYYLRATLMTRPELRNAVKDLYLFVMGWNDDQLSKDQR